MSGEAANIEMHSESLLQNLSCASCHQVPSQSRVFLSECNHVLCSDCLALLSERNLNDSSVNSMFDACPKCNRSCEFSENYVLKVLNDMRRDTSISENISCANCEQNFQADSMFYCETCKQSLCSECKIATHSARMFASHSVIPRSSYGAVIKCSSHPDSAAIIANTAQNEFVCVKCFSDFPDELKSSCGEISSTIQSKLSVLSQDFDRLQTQKAIVQGRVLENDGEFSKFRAVCNERKKVVADFAQELVDEVRKVEYQLISELDKEIESKEKSLQSSKGKSDSFISNVELHTCIFELVRTSNPNSEFLKLCAEMEKNLSDLSDLKTDCLSHKPATHNSFFDYKTPFKKLMADITTDSQAQASCFELDSLKFQNLSLIRTISQDPVQIQKLLDWAKPASPMLRLSAPANFSLDSPSFNRSLNSSCSLSSASRAKLCPEAEQARLEVKQLRKLYESNISKVQSLQLDVTRRKVYPKKVEAERLSSAIEHFRKRAEELILMIGNVIKKVGSKAQSPQPENDEEDFEFTRQKLEDWLKECKELQGKHEQMKAILKSIKPYILSVTKQKEKSNTRLTPVVPYDHLEDLKRSVVVDDLVQEQRIQAIEAMYKSQSMERSTVNNSEIQKELQLTKQKLKRAKCNPSTSSLQLGTAIDCCSSSQDGSTGDAYVDDQSEPSTSMPYSVQD